MVIFTQIYCTWKQKVGDDYLTVDVSILEILYVD